MSASTERIKTNLSQFPEVDRRAALSLREFKNEYLHPGRPVVITDAIESWSARSTWSLDHFQTRYGKTSVTVYRLGGERYDPSGTESMTLSDFIEVVKNNSFESYPCYVRDDWQLFKIHSELMQDYSVPKYFFDWFAFLPGFMRLI